MEIDTMKLHHLGIVAVTLTIVASCQSQTAFVNLYTDRHYDVDQTLYATFTAQTGIKVNVVKLDADPLLTRLETEGNVTEADIIFLADAGRLGRAKEKNLLKPFTNLDHLEHIEDYLIDVDDHWIGLTKRARVMVYDPTRTAVESLSTYEALADSSWFEKIAIRSASHVYNQSLVAAMILQIGEAPTKTWLDGFVRNFAIRDAFLNSKKPVGNDRDQAKAVYNGIADIAIMNSYYFGRMLHSEDPAEVTVAQSLRVFFPNQATFGTHINVSGMGLTKHGKRSTEAVALINFLLEAESQRVFADANFEYPIRTDVQPHPLLASWGNFKEQSLALSSLAEKTQQAFTFMVEAGWQ
jgi:iron(III) transport system substrate-binding protein